MVRWRKKIKWKKKVNSVNGGREGDERRSKKEEKRDKMNGGPKFGPHIKVTAELLSQLNQAELTQLTPKQKNSFFFLFFSIPRKKKIKFSKKKKKRKGWKFFGMD